MQLYDEKTMIRIPEIRAILRTRAYGNRRLRLLDISGGSSQGYDFRLAFQELKPTTFHPDGQEPFTENFWETVEVVADSDTASAPTMRNSIGGIGAYTPFFDRTTVQSALDNDNVRCIEQQRRAQAKRRGEYVDDLV